MDNSGWRIRDNGSGVDVWLHVQPRASRNEIAGAHNGAIKLKVSAPPADNAANRAVVEFFSSLLRIPKGRIKLIAGERSREKLLRIDGISFQDLRTHLPTQKNR